MGGIRTAPRILFGKREMGGGTLKIPNHTFEDNNKVDAKESVIVWIRFMKLSFGLWRIL